MASTVSDSLETRQRLIAETRPRMAKASLRKAEDWRASVGNALRQAVAQRGWSLKEFAAAAGRDERQCARWMSGDERLQLDTLFAIEDDAFRHGLVIALAALGGDSVEVTTQITVRRSA